MYVVKDIMSRNVVTMPPDTTLAEAASILAKYNISGAPVVSERGALVGIISELALMDVLFDRAMRDIPVSDCMTTEVHTIGSEESLSRAAHMLVVYGIRRLPVVEDGRLVGIVSCSDLLRHAIEGAEPLDDPLLELIPSLAQRS